jgi:hypothetical protein
MTKLFDEFVERNEISLTNKISAQQMQSFINDHLIPGIDLDGKPIPIIDSFNNQRVAGDVVEEFPRPVNQMPLDEAIERGKVFRRTREWLDGRTAGLAFGILMGAIQQAQGGLEVAANSTNFRKGVEALSQGDLVRADRYFLGSEIDTGTTGFFDDLVDENLVGAAYDFASAYRALRKRPEPPVFPQ